MTEAAGTRLPAVAGAFYPADSAGLTMTVRGLLDAAAPPVLAHPPRAVVVPHAGYVYSGSVAAAGYAAVWRSGATPGRIALAGPAHFVPLVGTVVPTHEAWSTPLGTVPIDAPLRDIALAMGARADDRPHRPEHAIEVQLPFLQILAGPALRVLPVAVGRASRAAVADLCAALLAEADLLVVATDLSHYQSEVSAQRIDGRTISAILAGEPDAIEDEAACGAFALRGIAELARRERWPVRLLARGTSADAGGDRDRVVGYAAIAIG